MVVRRIHSRNIRRNEDILDFLHSTVFFNDLPACRILEVMIKVTSSNAR